MFYTLNPDAPLTDAVRDVADDQISAALESLEGAFDDPEQAVHDTRKHCKKLRALLRLVRPGLGRTYGKENAAFRDITRTLSDVRDAQVLADAEDRAAVGLMKPLRDWAAARREAALGENTIAERVDAAHGRLGKARKRAARWDVSGPASDVIEGGLRRTYGRARRRCQDATPNDRPS